MYNDNTKLAFTTPPCQEADEYNFCYINEHNHLTIIGPPGTIFLPHSCGEWVIGGIPEAEQLLEDLQINLIKLNGI